MKISLCSLSTIVALATSTAGRTILRVTNEANSPFFIPSCVEDMNNKAADLHEVNLPGWVIGPSLKSRIIHGFTQLIDRYDADSFGQFVLEQCKVEPECTATFSYSSIYSGTPHERFWFGYTFKGGAVTPNDFELASSEEGARDARVYSV